MILDALLYAWRELAFLKPVLFIVALWLVWWVWMFVARPRWHKYEVHVYPYVFPFFGHAFSIFRNINSLYLRAHAHYGFTRDPYALHVAGQRIVVITKPSQMVQVFKDETSYSFDPVMDIIYRTVGGISDEGNRTLWRKPSDGFVSLNPNPQNNVLVYQGRALLHKQLHTPGRFQEIVGKVVSHIEQALRWNNFRQSTLLAESTDGKLVSLNNWVRDVAINAQTLTFFGRLMLEIEPDTAIIFNEYDRHSWMLTYQYPAFLCNAATAPREQLVKAFTAYIKAPKEKRLGDNVQFVDEVIDELRYAGLSDEDCSRLLMIILWGINANVQMATIWMMTEVLSRPSLMKAIRNEITPAMEALSKSDPPSEAEAMQILRSHIIESCPVLNSAYNEILRMYSTGSSIRITKRETFIDGKRIPEGVKLLLPQRQLLQDHAAYGPDAHEFDAWRFLKHKNLDRHEFYKPFGGGVSYCSGKAVGRYEVLTFVAWTLWRYECNIVRPGQEVLAGVTGRELPRPDLAKPSLGICKPVDGDDLILFVRERVRKDSEIV